MKTVNKNKKRIVPDIISPNVISTIRICLIPVFVFFFYGESETSKIIAAVIFAVAALTDFLDGFIARKFNCVTTIGKFLDPIADKVLVSTALVVLLTDKNFMFGEASYAWLPVAMGVCVAVIIARELIISVFREIAAEKNVVLAAGVLGKIKTFVQDFSIIFLILSIPMNYYMDQQIGLVFFIIGFVLFAMATGLTILSGVEYIVSNNKVLSKNK